MPSDIVKQIILRFRGDTRDLKDVEQALGRINKAANATAGSGPGATAGGGLSRTMKDLVNLNREYTKLGQSLPVGLEKASRAAREIANVHLKQAEKLMFTISDKAERRVKKLNELVASGASERRVAGQERLTMRALDQGLAAREKVASLQPTGFLQTPMGQLFRGFGVGALASGVANIPQFIAQQQRTALLEGTAAIAPTLQTRIGAQYGADLTMGVLQQQGVLTQAEEFGRTQNQASRRTSLLSSILGAGLVGAGGLITAGTLGGGAGLGLPMMLAGAGMAGYGAKQEIQRTYGSRDAYERATARQTYIDAAKERMLDPFLYNEFRKTAGQRSVFQMEQGVDSEQAFAFRQAARAGTPYSAEEAEAAAKAGRAPLGSDISRRAAIVANQIAGQQEMSLKAAQNIAQQLGLGGTAGKFGMQQDMESMFRDAVAGGITDSGLREALETGAANMVSIATTRLNTPTVQAQMMNFLPGGATDPRQFAGAQAAYQSREQRFAGGNPLDLAIKRSQAIRTLRKYHIPVTMTNLDIMTGTPRQDFEAGTPDTAAMGLNDKMRKEFINNTEQSMAKVNPDERRALQAIQHWQKTHPGQKTPANLTQALASARASAMGGQGAFATGTVEARTQAGVGMANILTGANTGATGQAVSAMTPTQKGYIAEAFAREQANRRKASGETVQSQFDNASAQKKDADIQHHITGHIPAIKDAQAKANAQLNAVGAGGDVGQASTDAIAAMGNFAKALDTLSSVMNQRFGTASPGGP